MKLTKWPLFSPHPNPLPAGEGANLPPGGRANLLNFMTLSGYFQIQATRPQTLAYGLTDSPAGQLAWIVEKFKEWTHPKTDLPEAAVERGRILTNVMLYWLTGTAGSSANLYYENMHAGSWGEAAGNTPTGVAVFAEDVAIRRYSEQGYLLKK